jgi:hypothetical protein
LRYFLNFLLKEQFLAYKKRSETEIQSSQQEREDKTLTSTAKTRSPENKIRRKLRALRAKRKKHERKLANVTLTISHIMTLVSESQYTDCMTMGMTVEELMR